MLGPICFPEPGKELPPCYDAIRASLLTSWSSGQCEGQICRVKLIKRLGYDRAKADRYVSGCSLTAYCGWLIYSSASF